MAVGASIVVTSIFYRHVCAIRLPNFTKVRCL